jgi:endonuclease/exonuclease/phosphatase (EEP) superfamily protein YafD
MLRRLLGKIVRQLPWLSLAVLVLVTLLAGMDRYVYLGGLCSPFRLYWSLLACVFAGWAWWRKRWRHMMLGISLALWHGVRIISLWRADATVVSLPEHPVELSVVSANLFAFNPRKPEGAARLLELDADVMVLIEVTDGWPNALGGVIQKYPYRLGIGGAEWLLSRYPLEDAAGVFLSSKYLQSLDAERVYPPDQKWEYNALLRATVVVGTQKLRVVAIHPYSPKAPHRYVQQFAQIKAYVEALRYPPKIAAQLLIGDLNTTPFSTVFEDIVASTGLRHAGAGYGYRPTWGPNMLGKPWLPWLGVPIDHGFISTSVAVNNYDLGETPGSDHRWQRLRVRF